LLQNTQSVQAIKQVHGAGATRFSVPGLKITEFPSKDTASSLELILLDELWVEVLSEEARLHGSLAALAIQCSADKSNSLK